MKPPIQFRPSSKRSSPSKAIPAKTVSKPGTRSPAPNPLSEFVAKGMSAQKDVDAIIEAYKETERAKVRERVRKHREKKKK